MFWEVKNQIEKKKKKKKACARGNGKVHYIGTPRRNRIDVKFTWKPLEIVPLSLMYVKFTIVDFPQEIMLCIRLPIIRNLVNFG